MQETGVAVVGMIILAAAVLRTEKASRAGWAVAILLGACGAAAIGIAASQHGGISQRVAVFGIYLGTGGLIGNVVGAMRRSQSGETLLQLGRAAAKGFKIVSAISISMGIISVAVRCMDALRPGDVALLVGQALFFLTGGAQAVIMATGEWRLVDQGIAGPYVFVPWPQVSGWGWADSGTLAVRLKPGFRGGRRFLIPVPEEAQEKAMEIISRKMAG
jgi:hypothetical protein